MPINFRPEGVTYDTPLANWSFTVTPNSGRDGLSIKGAAGPLANLLMVRDRNNAPIMWVGNVGGIGCTDGIRMLDNTLTQQIALTFEGGNYSKPRLAFGNPVNTAIYRDVTGLVIRVGGVERWNIAGDIVSLTNGGLVLASPNGTKYRLQVANDGTLSTVAV